MPLKVKRVLQKPTFKAKLFRSGSPRVQVKKKKGGKFSLASKRPRSLKAVSRAEKGVIKTALKKPHCRPKILPHRKEDLYLQ